MYHKEIRWLLEEYTYHTQKLWGEMDINKSELIMALGCLVNAIRLLDETNQNRIKEEQHYYNDEQLCNAT